MSVFDRGPRTAALYARVSKADGQTVENQLRQLRAVAERNGWTIVAEHTDEGISGAKGRDRRPGLDALLRQVVRREVDLVMAWSVDRLSRSMQDLGALLAELHAKNVDLFLHQQAIDTTTPGGKAMFQLFGVFAELERSLIVERTKAGLERARAEGKRLGRPSTPPTVLAAVRRELASGKGICKVAAELGVGVSVVQRVKREAA